MADGDILNDLLGRPDKAVRKAEGVVEPTHNNQGDESGYDLTNPNLHHGAEAKYAPTIQIVSNSGSIVTPAEEVFHEGRATGERSHLAIGDSGPVATAIADQSAFEGQAFSLNVSSNFKAAAAGEALPFSAKLPAGLGIDAHTSTTTGSYSGNNTVTVAATDAHSTAISESFYLAAGDSGPTATRAPLKARPSRLMFPATSKPPPPAMR
ncbi:MAG: hypothetical protein E6G79_02060 [Alphaproteobacteria bacterium]|nr:MAG: hypothetical protein E6G79_02060 [Alphaproteobacteria bacterium]